MIGDTFWTAAPSWIQAIAATLAFAVTVALAVLTRQYVRLTRELAVSAKAQSDASLQMAKVMVDEFRLKSQPRIDVEVLGGGYGSEKCDLDCTFANMSAYPIRIRQLYSEWWNETEIPARVEMPEKGFHVGPFDTIKRRLIVVPTTPQKPNFRLAGVLQDAEGKEWPFRGRDAKYGQ